MDINLKVPGQVAEIIRKFTKNGYEIYIVGGVVRDIMLDRQLYDWDFTTNALPEQILAMFPDGFYDNKYGTVGIPSAFSKLTPTPPTATSPLTPLQNYGEGEANELTPTPLLTKEKGSDNDLNNRPYEITTFRTEQGYSDGRHPDEVVWGKVLEEDLKRRDFTINAMALKKVTGSRFQVIDLWGGIEDIKAGLIRCVGDPNERFGEDALRMMRAVRIATQLHFAIEDNTFLAIQAGADKIKQVSAERIRDELLKTMGSEYPADGYLLLRNTGLAAQIVPEMEGAFDIEQKSPGRHHIYDVGTHSVESLRHCSSPDPITRLATLLHDSGKVRTQRKHADGRITFYNHEMESERIAREIAERLRLANDDKDRFVRLVRWHQFTVDEHQTDAAVRRFIKNVGLENIPEMLALRTGDRLGGGARETSWRLEEFKKRLLQVQKQPFAIQDLKISGNDVMQVKGIGPGPAVGKYLEKLFNEVVEKGLPNEKDVLLKRLGELSF